MIKELKDGDRLIDTDGDIGTAFAVRKGADGVRFDMNYDKGMFIQNMLYAPITDNPVDLGFSQVEAVEE